MLDVLYRFRDHFTPMLLLSMHSGLIRSSLECGSHIWGDSRSTALLDRVESKASRLSISSPLTDSPLQPFSLHRKVASFSLSFSHYHNEHYSSKLSQSMLPILRRDTILLKLLFLTPILSNSLLQKLIHTLYEHSWTTQEHFLKSEQY